MNYETFNELYYELSTHVENLLIKKAAEYANKDRLYNFRQMTSLLRTNPARIATFYQSKHYASIIKITEEIDQGIIPNKETILEKAGDLIAYTYLVYACLMELADPSLKIGSIPHAEAPRSDSKPKDNTTTVSQEKQQIEKTSPKIDWENPILGESIASPITDQDKLNLTTIL